MTKTDRLFVYGTLMKGFRNPVARHLHSTQHFLGEAYFPGLIFKVSFYPGAVYLPESETKVFGHLFKITQNKKQLLQKLDEYEGIGTQLEQPDEFRRDVVPVFFNGETIHAYTYLFNTSYNQYPVLTSGRFSQEV